MKIHFKSSSLRKICEDSREAGRKLGFACARSLRSRIADIQASSCVGELTAGRPHPLKGKRKGQMAIRLNKRTRLVFSVYRKSNFDLEIDWSKVDEIEIAEIVDYHD